MTNVCTGREIDFAAQSYQSLAWLSNIVLYQKEKKGVLDLYSIMNGDRTVTL